MKYSTFRSKRCEPSRCSRIALFVSGVIQFSRPISSSGPHGLFETLRPSCSCSAFGVNALSTRHRCSSLVRLRPAAAPRPAPRTGRAAGGRRGRARTRRGRRSPCRWPSRGRRRRRAASLGRVGLGESVAKGVNNLTASAELAPPLLADAVRDEEVDAVLGGARECDDLALQAGGHGKLVGSATRSAPCSASVRVDLREAEVVADIRPILPSAVSQTWSSSPGVTKRSTPRNGRCVFQ